VVARQAFDRNEARIKKQMETYQTYREATSQNLGDAARGPALTAGKKREVLEANLANLSRLHEQTVREMKDIGQKRLELQRTQRELEAHGAELKDLDHRIEVLQAQTTLGGRLSVISSGEQALSPDRDPRIKAAIAVGLGGAALPSLVLVLLSMAKRKYRHSDEMEALASPSSIPLLGILPELAEREPSPERTGLAAHCVHQIRVTLRALQGPNHGPRVYLLTSASSGEGKTSLSMSLGLSFAAARLRTLVVDADLVGRHMTTALQGRELEGLHEALAAGTLRGVVRKVWTGLSVLTAGKAGSADACTLSSGAMKALLSEARKHFDVILVDAGPILGSLEAAVLAQEVDGVIFTITRGQPQRVVRAAIQRLHSLGVNVAGFIFNRANQEDLHRSAFSSSSRLSTPLDTGSSRMNMLSGGSDRPLATRLEDRFSRFGVLVQAVAAGMPS
jgi:capsular exopolysaccharide synthesis family protein